MRHFYITFLILIGWFNFSLVCAQPSVHVSSSCDGEIVSIPALRNPNRGFHLEMNLTIPELKNPWSHKVSDWDNDVKNAINSLEAAEDSLTLIQQNTYLTDYLLKDLDNLAFDKLNLLFESMKRNGFNAILRFAYNSKGLNCPAGETEERILKHIHQLTPFFREHIGQIATLQAGFFGAWGEWHTSKIYGDQQAKNHIVSALLEAIPEPYTVQIRYPVQKRMLTLLDESQRGRLGFNNDYFTVGEHSHAPANDYVGEDYDYVRKDVAVNNQFVLGEIPYPEKSEWGLHKLITPMKVLKVLSEHRYSALDLTQNYALNIKSWKSIKVCPKILRELGIRFDQHYFLDEKGNEVVRSMYQFIRDHLGYRLNLQESAQFNVKRKSLKYKFTLTNTGFARPINPAEMYLVLIKDDNVVKEVRLDTNVRDLLPMSKDKPTETKRYCFEGEEKIKGVKGKYKIGLWLPEQNELMKYNAVTNIKLANNGNIEHWWSKDGRYAVNILGEVKF